MWTRSLLKENAKKSMKNYYWTAFFVCILAGWLGNFSCNCNSGSSSSSGYPFTGEETEMFSGDAEGTVALLLYVGIMLLIFTAIYVLSLAIVMAFYAFLGGPIEVGLSRFFIRAREGNADFNHLFGVFRKGKYMATVKVMFFKELYITLWSLLFIVPGIIKSLEYLLIPYLLAENPNLPKERAFEISKRTMDGEKWDFFVLRLSFIGWELLGMLLCCIGIYFIEPYRQATYAEFYACMRAKMIAYGITTEEELSGASNVLIG